MSLQQKINIEEIIAHAEIVNGDVTLYRKNDNTIDSFLLQKGQPIYKNDLISTSSDSAVVININEAPLFLSSLESFRFSSSTLSQFGNITSQASLYLGGQITAFESLEKALESGESIEDLLEKPDADDLDDSVSLLGDKIIIWPRDSSEIIPDNDTYQDSTRSIFIGNGNTSSLRQETGLFITARAEDDSFSLLEDNNLVNIDVLANDISSIDNSIIRFDSTSVNGGTVILGENNTFSYQPLENFNGSDSFTYTIRGLPGQDTTATVRLNVIAVSDGTPKANDDNATIDEDNTVTVDIIANDFLPDEARVLSYSSLSSNGAQVISNNDGTFTYIPVANYNGTDTFTYTIIDSDGQTDTATVTLTVVPVTDGTPQAIDDSTTTLEDIAVIISPLTNDNLIDEASIINFDATSSQGATVTQTAEGAFTYTPVLNYNGIDSFTYTIKDSDGESSTATITVNITPVNDTPINNLIESPEVPRNGLLSFDNASGNLITLTDVDGDIERTELSVSDGILNIVSADVVIIGNSTSNVVISGSQDDINDALSSLTYQPNTNFGGFDTLTIHTTDSDNSSDIDSITIKVAVEPSMVDFNVGMGGTPYSTGLTANQYTDVYEEHLSGLDNSDSIESDIENSEVSISASRMTQGAGAVAQTTVIDATNSIALNSNDGNTYALTGLIYLEAGSEYRFAGSRDDALHIELGGQTMVNTEDDSAGYFSTQVNDNNKNITESTFFPMTSGYYSLEVYTANLSGSGELALNLSVNNTDYMLSADNFSFFSNASELIAAGGLIDSFTSNAAGGNPDGGYFAHNGAVDIIGIEGQRIQLTNFSINLAADDTLINLEIEIPEGATLYGGEGQIFSSTPGNNSIDIFTNGWSLTELSLSLPNATAGDIVDINISATTQTVSLDTMQSNTSLAVSILPVDFAGIIDNDLSSNPASTGDDALITGSGFNDTLTAALTGNTVILGHNGDDQITGNDNDNTLFGGNGNDTIISGAGSDMIFGGKGSDTLVGGDNVDRFMWLLNDGDGSTDVITNFTQGASGDMLDLSNLLEGETTGTLSDFLQLTGSMLGIDVNGDNSGFDDLLIDLTDLGATSLDSLIEHNIAYDSGRSVLAGTTSQDTMTGRQYNGLSTNEDFYDNGGGDNITGNGGADRFIVVAGAYNELLPTEDIGTIRIQDLFTFGAFDGVSEADALDLSGILIGEHRTNIHNYLTIDTHFAPGGIHIEVDIDGNNSGADFKIHIKQDNLDIEADLGYTDDTNQLEILQLLIDYGNLVID
jgi:Ca2+-binding RTX toxin-like protein